MATYASKLRKTAVDGQTIRLLPDGRIRGNAGMEPFSAGTKGGAPSVFYVDGNVVSSGNGLSWLSAVKTLAEGLAMAHAYMSTSGNRAWAHRATVYACGDALTEDLVILAEKSDIIGVGSNSGMTKPSLIGNHVPVTTNTWGTRWFNINFAEVDSGAIWTLTATSAGIQFHECEFSSGSGNTTHGILATAPGQLIVDHCDFHSSTSKFTTGCIVFGAGDAARTRITNNFINGAIGIVVNASTTVGGGQMIIDSNVFRVATLAVDDNANISLITRNMIISAADNDTMTLIIDEGAGSVGNIVTGSSSTQTHPFATVS